MLRSRSKTCIVAPTLLYFGIIATLFVFSPLTESKPWNSGGSSEWSSEETNKPLPPISPLPHDGLTTEAVPCVVSINRGVYFNNCTSNQPSVVTIGG
jgi:hypothetical protein